ncbi:putative large subunit terminase [Fusobacterium phage vB_FnuS_FNU4]|nr:putative large subunit terminase [Fusobacterium phage vB_FnuS_FNU4]
MKAIINYLESVLKKREKEKQSYLIFKPRKYQQEFVKKYDEGIRFFAICWCRRMGKDMFALYVACRECIKNPRSIVYYIFPTIKQGKMMILEGFTNEKERILEAIISKKALKLPEKSDKLFHSDNSIRFKNGSIIYFVDSRVADTKVGGNLDLVVSSETAMQLNPTLLDLLLPAIENVDGKLILVSTPRLGSQFNEIIESNDEKYYKDIMNALDVRAVDDEGNKIWTDEKLENARKMMSKSKFEEELLCNLDVAKESSIYGYSLTQAEWIKDLTIVNKKLYVSEDLGINDSTALVFTVDNTIIHHYAATDKATIHYIEYIKTFMKEHNIKDVEIILPHDARNRQDAIDYLTSRREAYNKHFRDVRVLRAYEVNKTIEITRHSIEQHKIKFLDCTSVREMVRLMKVYEWKIDNSTGENLRVPVHGRGLAASNTCDAVEYYCMRMFLEIYEKNIKDLDWGSYED